MPGSRLRKRDLIPEDEPIVANLTDPKIVTGKFGRQLQVTIRVIEGEYRGTTFKEWLSFRTDDDTKEEYISYGSSLYNVLKIVDPDIDETLDDEDLTDKAYESWLHGTAAKLGDEVIRARVLVHTANNDPSKKRNKLDPGSIGVYEDMSNVGDELSD